MKLKLFTATALLLCSSLASAAGALSVDNAVTREAPPGAKVTAAFMKINNSSAEDVIIKGVESPQFARVEMHLSKTENDVAMMIQQDKLVVPAKGDLVLQHGSWHLMLYTPKQALKEGDPVELILDTTDGTMNISAPVKRMMMKMGH